MGTNYYLKKKHGGWTLPANGLARALEKECIRQTEAGEASMELDLEKCVEKTDLLHIGKSSAGWHFDLCIYPFMGIYGLDDWKPLFSDHGSYSIIDEDGEEVPFGDMLATITEREGSGISEEESLLRANRHRAELGLMPLESYEELLEENHAERGINGLWAHKSVIDDLRKEPGFEGFAPLLLPHYRTEGTYDLDPEWDFS